MVLTLVDRLAAPLADAHLAAVGELLDPDADGPIAAAAHEEHVREVERALSLDNAALTQLLRRPLVLLDHVDLFDEHAPGADEHTQHPAALAALLARDDGDRVAPPDVTHGSASRWSSRGWGPAVQGEPVNGSASRWTSRGWGPAVQGEPVNGSASRWTSRGWGPAVQGEPVNGSASRWTSRGQ